MRGYSLSLLMKEFHWKKWIRGGKVRNNHWNLHGTTELYNKKLTVRNFKRKKSLVLSKQTNSPRGEIQVSIHFTTDCLRFIITRSTMLRRTRRKLFSLGLKISPRGEYNPIILKPSK